MSSDGRNKINLSNHPGYDSTPAWNPFGRRLAFVSSREGNPEIFIMNDNGSSQRAFTSNQFQNRRPGWSPTGGKIIYESFVGGNFEIFVIGSDGGRGINLTENPANDQKPVWSPFQESDDFSGDDGENDF
jgi:TolB protein